MRQYEFNSESVLIRRVMKQTLVCLIVSLCAISFADADQTIRSLQQTLKEQGFYYGAVTGEKSAETTAAIRRYQIRQGLQVTGELNEETSRAIKPNSNSVAAQTRSASKPAVPQPANARPDVSAPLTQTSPPASANQPNRPLQTSPSYAASFYQSAPLRVNRRSIAAAQYQLMSRGYYRGPVDGKYGRRMAFALRAFQSGAGLPPTGRLDTETLEALGTSGTDLAYSAPTSGGYESWMPVRKFKNGKWKMKWKRYHRTFEDEVSEDRQVNSQPDWNPYNQNY